MAMRSEIKQLSQLITDYSVGIKRGDRVLIDSDPTGTSRLHVSLHEEILKRGGIPFHKLTLGECDFLNVTHAQDFQMEAFADDDKNIMENIDVLIGIQGSVNPRRLDQVDVTKLIKFSQTTRIVRKLTYERFKSGDLRLLYVEYPTIGAAQDCCMPLFELEQHFCRACFLDERNAVEKIELKGDDIDLTFTVDGEWTSDHGVRYLPDGEIFTDYVVKNSVNGRIKFSYPAFFQRKRIDDIELEFNKGNIVNARSSNDDIHLRNILKSENHIYMSAFGIGTNPKITKFIGNISFDEKMGGTIHLALRAPMWVLIKNMEKEDEIFADGTVLYKNRDFVI
jgi:aminopeptidase